MTRLSSKTRTDAAGWATRNVSIKGSALRRPNNSGAVTTNDQRAGDLPVRRRLRGERSQLGEDGPEDVKLLQAEARQLEGARRPMEQTVTGLLFQQSNAARIKPSPERTCAGPTSADSATPQRSKPPGEIGGGRAGDSEHLVLLPRNAAHHKRHAGIRHVDNDIDVVDIEPLASDVRADIRLVLHIGADNLNFHSPGCGVEILHCHFGGDNRSRPSDVGIET